MLPGGDCGAGSYWSFYKQPVSTPFSLAFYPPPARMRPLSSKLVRAFSQQVSHPGGRVYVPTDREGDATTRYSGCRPFLVEDDADFRLLLVPAFSKAGIPKDRLRTFPDGESAIQALKTVTPDPLMQDNIPPSLIVLDVNLPKMSGLDVLAWIRQTPTLRDVPVFMLSSSEHSDHVTQAFALRTDSYYVKPRDFSELQTVIEGMLGFWHSRTYRRLPGSDGNQRTL